MIAEYRLNTLIAEAMKFASATLAKGATRNVWQKFIITLSPIFPYLAEEIWHDLGNKESVFRAEWPKHGKKTLNLELKVLVNQKYVTTLNLGSDDLGEDRAVELAKKDPALKTKLAGKTIKAVVYRPNQLLNFVLA